MPTLMVLLAVLLLTGCAAVDELKEFEFENPAADSRNVAPGVCRFENVELPDDLIVYAAGGYTGRELDFQIDQSGHAATQFDIAVNSERTPVALILGAYEPTIWNVGWTRRTRIVAVFASGYHRQVVAGLPDDVPVLVSTYANRGPCGYFYIGRDRDDALDPQAQDLFGRPVTRVYRGDRTGSILIGDPLQPGTSMVTSAKNSPESYRDASAPLAGLAGLEDAVAKGLIRPATSADADAWFEAQTALPPRADQAFALGQRAPEPRRPHLFRAYVVLGEFTYPAGLYGGNSATFFIAEGVPPPSGNPGHSAVYDFNSLTCRGVGCSR